MNATHLHDELHHAREHATELTVYHIGALVSTLTAIMPDTIETRSGVKKRVVHERAEVLADLDTVIAAQPAPVAERTEYRWKLVFTDAAGARLLEVYAETSGRFGMIGEQPVRFHDDALLAHLNARYGR
jgi:hypothetical protein